MARLHADECFPLAVVVELRQRGHDVLTAVEAGRAGQELPDPDVLAFAVSTGRAVLTHNRRHFVRLHRTEPGHAGIIVCTRDDDGAALAERIDRAIAAAGALAGRLIRVNRPSKP